MLERRSERREASTAAAAAAVVIIIIIIVVVIVIVVAVVVFGAGNKNCECVQLFSARARVVYDVYSSFGYMRAWQRCILQCTHARVYGVSYRLCRYGAV